jgi:hypothetical protein
MKTLRTGSLCIALIAALAWAISGLGAAQSIGATQSAQLEGQLSNASGPEAVPGMPLPPEGLVWILDSPADKPQLLRLYVNSGANNLHRGKNLLRSQVFANAVITVDLPMAAAKIRIASHSPVIFIRMTTDEQEEAESLRAGNVNVVQTRFVLLRLHPAGESRALLAISAPQIAGAAIVKEDVVDSTTEQIAGGPWRKIAPAQPLPDGEYAVALVPTSVKDVTDITSEAYDFGVGPAAASRPK